jgi:hypothetical protein
VTATLSVAASQARLIVVEVAPVARRFGGALGGAVSFAGVVDGAGVGVSDGVVVGVAVAIGVLVAVAVGAAGGVAVEGMPATSQGR